jgi:hypothetical protein
MYLRIRCSGKLNINTLTSVRDSQHIGSRPTKSSRNDNNAANFFGPSKTGSDARRARRVPLCGPYTRRADNGSPGPLPRYHANNFGAVVLVQYADNIEAVRQSAEWGQSACWLGAAVSWRPQSPRLID